jgi:hypothetical protein
MTSRLPTGYCGVVDLSRGKSHPDRYAESLSNAVRMSDLEQFQ